MLASTSEKNRGILRQQKILEVAEHLFLTKGYAGTSVNEVVKLSGGSLNTLYRYFGNKLGLFEAVFTAKTADLFAPFQTTDFWQADMRSNLLAFGGALQEVALSPEGIAIYRLVITENNQEQEKIQKIFYSKGPQTAFKILADYLILQRTQGHIHVEHPEMAANQFIEMVKGPFLYPALFGQPLEQAKIQLALEQAVELFLEGCLQTQLPTDTQP